jgi:PAS domain-containing protein
MEIDPEGLASLLANIDEVILTIDRSGTITFCNPTVRDVYGWAPE